MLTATKLPFILHLYLYIRMQAKIEQSANFYLKINVLHEQEEPLVIWGGSAVNYIAADGDLTFKMEFFINQNTDCLFQSGYIKIFILNGLDGLEENCKIQIEAVHENMTNIIFDGFVDGKPLFEESFGENITILFLTSCNPDFKKEKQIEAESLSELFVRCEEKFDVKFRIPESFKQGLKKTIKINAFGNLERYINYIQNICGILVFNSFDNII